MSAVANIGFIQPITDIAHVHGALSQKFCTAVSFQNPLPGNILQALNQITAQDLAKLRGVTIDGSVKGKLLIRGQDRDVRFLNCPTVPDDFGLPPDVIALIESDHLDFVDVTGSANSVSFLRVGNDLTVNWHTDRKLTADVPQAHRNLSGPGMYIASANPVTAVNVQQILLNATFFSPQEIQKNIEAGGLTVRQQKLGERLYFTDGFLHRSLTVHGDRESEHPHLRMISRCPLPF